MSDAQKIIKYVSIAFALFLIVNIIGGIFFAFISLANIFTDDENYEDIKEQTNVINEINYIDINLKTSDLKIKNSNEFKIETTSDNIKYQDINGKLIVKEKNHHIFSNNKDKFTLYLPLDKIYEEVKITNGAGLINIEKISSNNLHLDLGAGKVVIDNLEVYMSTIINGGAGKITINNGLINYLGFDIGVGEVNLTAKILGESEIDCGVGATTINLLGSKEDYKISVDKGIGEFLIDNESASDEQIYGTGKNQIDIDGGIGKVAINFKDYR